MIRVWERTVPRLTPDATSRSGKPTSKNQPARSIRTLSRYKAVIPAVTFRSPLPRTPRATSGSQAGLSAPTHLRVCVGQESIRPHTLRGASLAAALSFGRLGYRFQGLPPQRNSPSALLSAPSCRKEGRTHRGKCLTGVLGTPSYAAHGTPRFAQTAVKHERVFLPPSSHNARSRCCGFAEPPARTVPNSFNRSCRSTINRRGISLP